MELSQSAGIVLKIFPQNHTVKLFDRELGVIEARSDLSLKTKRLCNGSYIVYVLHKHKGKHVLSNVDFIHVPFSWARADILFLHHVLELTAYFLPPQSPHGDIFHLIRALYAGQVRTAPLFKKKFLIRFFIMLGMYPDDEELLKKMLIIVEKPIDVIGEDSIHLEATHIDAWLLACIRMHPYNKLFKTSHFLTQQ